jgi:hypothetical protein
VATLAERYWQELRPSAAVRLDLQAAAAPAAAAAHQAGPLTDASGGPFRRVSVAPRWRGSCRVRSPRSDAGGGGGAVAVLVLLA